MKVIRLFIQPLFLLGRIYWFLFRPRTHGVKCIIEHEGKYLYIRNNYGSGRWTFPGGGVKRKETAKEAIRREIKEEVDIVLEDISFLGSFQDTEKFKQDIIDVFHAQVKSNEYKRNIWEIAEVQWFDKQVTPEPSVPVVGLIIDKFIIKQRS